MYLFISFLLSFIFPGIALADTQIGGCDTDDLICQLGYNAASGTGNIISKVIQFLFVIAVILALGFLVYGGIKWLTSGGDKDAVASARGMIIAAIVGLIVIFLAYFILNFILLFLTGSGFESISIPRIFGGNETTDGTTHSALCGNGGQAPCGYSTGLPSEANGGYCNTADLDQQRTAQGWRCLPVEGNPR